VPLPEDLSLDTEVLCRAGTLEAFTAVMTRGPFKQGLLVVADLYKKRPKPFFVEAGLDHGYLVELLRLARGLRGGDRDEVLAIACQEVDTFHLALAARGRFHYDLKPEMLVPLHVPGSRIAVDRFRRMVAAERLADLVPTLVGTAIDALPPGTGADNADASLLEHLAWNRYYRLANRTFRRSHMGMGAVAAYAAIRRVELANLIRLTEGIRAGFDPKAIRRRLIPRSDLERARV
jgi:vacuolar-type H+-ATPase subunit C/Vma6